jgi:hypothetical protein
VRPKKYSQEQITAIVDARGKITMDHVAAILGVSRSAVSGIWHRADLKKRATPTSTSHRGRVNVAEARRMRWNGALLQEIADKFGVTPKAIRYHVSDIICPVEHRGKHLRAA